MKADHSGSLCRTVEDTKKVPEIDSAGDPSRRKLRTGAMLGWNLEEGVMKETGSAVVDKGCSGRSEY